MTIIALLFLFMVGDCTYTGRSRHKYTSSPSKKSSSSSGGGVIYGQHKHKCITGVIQMYSGDIDDIPDGFQICDGTSKTVDLRGRIPIATDQKHYKYGQCGGNKHINLNINQLPEHNHDFKDVVVSKNGQHIHKRNGIIKNGGDHIHLKGTLNTLSNGKHSHAFTTKTNEGEHKHVFDLMTDYSDDHNHGIKVITSQTGNHEHLNDFKVDADGLHSHPIEITIIENGIHNHKFKGNDILIDIPDHEHDVGRYTINNHIFKHQHNVNGKTTANGEHYHNFETKSDLNGDHDHLFSIYTDSKGVHSHNGGTFSTTTDGKHKHDINEYKTANDGDHDHTIPSYFEIDYNTYSNDNIFDLALDSVDKGQEYTLTTGDDSEHCHAIPATTTLVNDDHEHMVKGNTGPNGNHTHAVEGTIKTNGAHAHDVKGDTSKKDNHKHEVTGMTNVVEMQLSHVLSGKSAPASMIPITTIPPYKPPTCALEYAGSVEIIDGNDGFQCATMTDAEIDTKLDNACEAHYTGSRNIKGTEISDGAYLNIVNLPAKPAIIFVPSCPGCGATCDIGGSRLCAGVLSQSWDTNDDTWVTFHGGNLLTAECVYDSCDTDDTSFGVHGSILDNVEHTHYGTGKIGDEGEHVHPLSGDIVEDGLHYHEIDDKTQNAGGHKHIVEGIISKGSHIHEIRGKTDEDGQHQHVINGETEYNGVHTHQIEISIEQSGIHKHDVDGSTCPVGKNEPIMILPPYVPVYFICCTNADHLYSRSSSSSSKSSKPSNGDYDDGYKDGYNDSHDNI